MDLGTLRTLARDIAVDVHGVPITVTLPAPDDGPYETRGIWESPSDEAQPYGTDLRRREPRRVMAIVKDDTITALPRGTRILAAGPMGGVVLTWQVDGYASAPNRVESDRLRVSLVPLSDLL